MSEIINTFERVGIYIAILHRNEIVYIGDFVTFSDDKRTVRKTDSFTDAIGRVSMENPINPINATNDEPALFIDIFKGTVIPPGVGS